MRGFVIDCAALSAVNSNNAAISVKMTCLATCKLFPEFFINILQEFSRCFVPLLLGRSANEASGPSGKRKLFSEEKPAVAENEFIPLGALGKANGTGRMQ